MIGSLRGKLISKKPVSIVIEANGVGYEVSVPISVLSSLPDEGSEVFVYIYTHVREDALQLYGFIHEEEKGIFVKIINISGIGPKIALAILSTITVERFRKAIESEDTKTLSMVPGVGKKMAARLVLELKDKLPSQTGTQPDDDYTDTISALVNLGYKRSDCINAIEHISKRGVKDIESVLRESLKYLSKSN
ncbi:MAG: Holliday junction branch migration protein RuvA [Nitrospirae bacterium]|nr:Holliday junction branch migration protein RuvA [Nitrospirota bacterium]MBF0534819.1 Holliday junction branch migration protein RuvA [Nitrospirota bacterium]MBF0616493.1 Holliday junction branch migration protein RuvA [Nitrospirota bacterium]